MLTTIYRSLAVLLAAAPLVAGARPSAAQLSLRPADIPPDGSVVWEVKNRFRLFREEKDFNRHLAVTSGRSILAAEQTLEQETAGRGWARDMVVRLCLDGAGRVVDTCMRDGVRESYLTPVDHRVAVKLAGRIAPGSTCAWTFDTGEGTPQSLSADCAEDVNLRARYGKITAVTVEISAPSEAPKRATGEILVRDLLIAGLGASIAAGEGNPDRPVALSDDGFCFRTFGGGRTEYFRPGRVGYKGDKACDSGGSDMSEWARLSARWMSAACHRSLYSYQMRAA